jgi:hypothetical protein
MKKYPAILLLLPACCSCDQMMHDTSENAGCGTVPDTVMLNMKKYSPEAKSRFYGELCGMPSSV